VYSNRLRFVAKFVWAAFAGKVSACFEPEFLENSLFPSWRLVSQDCIHHHPVFPNRGNPSRSKRGRFCGDLGAYFQRSRSLLTIVVSRVNFWPPVSASKNSVPRRLTLGRQLTSRRGRGSSERGELRPASKPIADSIRGFRTVGSIPREHREAARHQCRGANDLRPQL
jgi:hypothetical protein